MTDTSPQRPPISGLHHFAATVSDVEASADWYARVLGLHRLPVAFPHHGGASPGFGVVLMEPTAGFSIGLHHHEQHVAGAADETRSGLDHLAMAVPERADLDRWAARLDALGVTHSGVTQTDEPVPYAVLVFRDPDNLQLEFVHMSG